MRKLVSLLASAMTLLACTAQAQVDFGDLWAGKDAASVFRSFDGLGGEDTLITISLGVKSGSLPNNTRIVAVPTAEVSGIPQENWGKKQAIVYSPPPGTMTFAIDVDNDFSGLDYLGVHFYEDPGALGGGDEISLGAFYFDYTPLAIAGSAAAAFAWEHGGYSTFPPSAIVPDCIAYVGVTTNIPEDGNFWRLRFQYQTRDQIDTANWTETGTFPQVTGEGWSVWYKINIDPSGYPDGDPCNPVWGFLSGSFCSTARTAYPGPPTAHQRRFRRMSS
jgi:hypothetical protein